MCFTIDQIERACGLLLLNEFNTFTYCCKHCRHEFDSGPYLEVHILSEHQENKDTVFMNDDVFVDDFISTTIECGPTAVKLESSEENGENVEILNELNVNEPKEPTEESSDEDTPLADLLRNDDSDNDGSIETENDEPTKAENDRPTKTEKKNHPRPDESTEPKNETTITKKRRGRPIGWRKRGDGDEASITKKRIGRPVGWRKRGDGDEASTLGIKKSHSKRPRGRPPGAKNINYCEDGVMRNFAIDDEVGIPDRKTGRPTTGILYCEMCPDLKFDGKMNLTKHMHYHVLEKRKCEICNKIPRKGYERHMKKFHTVQLHKCDICDATFKVAISLVAHMRNHQGAKPYEVPVNPSAFLCDTCGKSFATQALYRQHENLSHGIKKYQCQHCDRSFHKPFRLRDHINAFHTLQRPHVCDMCGKAFKSTSYLRVHKKTHGDKVLPCRYCDKMFKLSENRHKHEVSIHKIVKINSSSYQPHIKDY